MSFDKKVVLTYIKNYFEYIHDYTMNPKLDNIHYLKEIIYFCDEMNYPALEIFLLGGLTSFRYPELQLTTGWSNEYMAYVNDLCLNWFFEDYQYSDQVIAHFILELNDKVRQDRKKNKW